MKVNGWTSPEIFRKIPPNPFVGFAVQDWILEEVKANVVDESRYNDIAPPRVTFVDPDVVRFDVETEKFALAVEVEPMMEGASAFGVMDVKFDESIVRVFCAAPQNVISD